MTRVRERVQMKDAVALAHRLRALLDGEARGANRIAIATETGQLLIDADEIEWIESEDYYAGIHAGGKHYRLRESLSTLETRLDPARFVRIHRSAIVRLDQVRELIVDGDTDTEAVVVLRDGTRLPVSRRRMPQVRALLRSP
jgi:two-component system LytT family response regulator